MTARRQALSRSEWTLVLRWVLATTVGWIVGFAVCEVVVKPIVYTFSHFPSDGAVIGIAIGIGQWLVLRRRTSVLAQSGDFKFLAGSGYRTAWWALASSAGFAIGKDVGDMLAAAVSGPAAVGLDGVVIGIALGLAQWLVLRRHVAAAGWWIAASAIAWAVGWSIINTVDPEAAGTTGLAYLLGSIGAAAAGLVTGASLAWLMRRSRDARLAGALAGPHLN
jgi:hypothetical protein